MPETRTRVDWATLLRRTFDVDVTRCTGCAGRMTMRAVVTDLRPSTPFSPRCVARATHPSPPDLATVQRATRRVHSRQGDRRWRARLCRLGEVHHRVAPVQSRARDHHHQRFVRRRGERGDRAGLRRGYGAPSPMPTRPPSRFAPRVARCFERVWRDEAMMPSSDERSPFFRIPDAVVKGSTWTPLWPFARRARRAGRAPSSRGRARPRPARRCRCAPRWPQS